RGAAPAPPGGGWRPGAGRSPAPGRAGAARRGRSHRGQGPLREAIHAGPGPRGPGQGGGGPQAMTLAKRLVPCLDVDRGRVVKGVKFVSRRDAGDPVECAARYDAEGADELVFLDITASSDARP